MKITEEVMSSIRTAVRVYAGKQLRPEERFDVAQEVAIAVASHSPEDSDTWIKRIASNQVDKALRDKRAEKETLEGLYTLAATPRYKLSLQRDPMVNYMAVKPVLRGSGENDVEDALIGAIDARARFKRGPKRVPTCLQDKSARKQQLAEQKRTLISQRIV